VGVIETNEAMKMEVGLKKQKLAGAGSLTGHIPLTQQGINAVLDYFKWFLDNGYKPAGGHIAIYLDPDLSGRLWITVYLMFQEKNWLERMLGL